MRKTSKKQAAKNLKNEASSKNLEFLLVAPRQQNVPNKTLRTLQPRKCSTQMPSEFKKLPNKVSTRASTSAARKCAVPVPRIDMDVDDNQHQMSVKINLLRDWNSDTDDENEHTSAAIGSNVLPKAGSTKTYPRKRDVASRSLHSISSRVDCQQNEGSADPEPVPAPDPCPSVDVIGEAADDPTSDSLQSDIALTTSDSEPASPSNERSSVPATAQQGTSGSNACVCGQQSKIDYLIKQNKMLKAQCKKLKTMNEETNMRCLRLTDALNLKLLRDSEPQEVVFNEIDGFPDKEMLKRFSEAASSDFVFVKLMMHHLWPAGFRDRSVTGRCSNNPHGRGGKSDKGCEPEPSGSKIPLEPEKASYIEDRLEEHRLYRGDTPAVARVKSKECGRYMARVIAYYGKK